MIGTVSECLENESLRWLSSKGQILFHLVELSSVPEVRGNWEGTKRPNT